MFCFCAVGLREANHNYSELATCAKENGECKIEKWKDDNNMKWDTYENLVEKYPDNNQGVSMYSDYISFQTTVIWLGLFQLMVGAFFVIGVVLGIILYNVYKKKTSKETKKAKKK